MTLFNRVSVLGLALLLAAGASHTMLAQKSPSADGSSPTLIQHLRSELQHEDLMRREAALMDVISLANCPESCTINLYSVQEKRVHIENETGKGAVIDLTALVPDLLDNYRKGPADGYRLMALSALIRIGDEKSLEKLLQKRPFQSEKVRHTTERGLAQFYLEKYPELQAEATRTGQLTIRDVKRAKAVRIKAEKKMLAANPTQ